MKELIHFTRIHYYIETDNVITHEFVLNLIKTNSVDDSKSDNYAKIVKITNEENKQTIEVLSTEKVYRIVYNKKLKATITINEKN